MRYVILAAALPLLAACAQPAIHVAPSPSPAGPRGASPTLVRVQVRERGSLVVVSVPIEEYVAATILSEFDPPAGDERAIEKMFEVQAVISRSYAMAERGRHAREGFDLCSTTHCQVYEPARLRTSRWAGLARRAAERTAGGILSFAGAPARALFHADCGGHTSSAQAIWGGAALPYLASAADAGAARRAHAAEWTFDAQLTAVRDALNDDARTAVGRSLAAVEVADHDAAGRAERLVLKGSRTVTVRGEVFREVLTRRFGVKSLRSTLFRVSRRHDQLLFTGRGFGHGVGLCQTGAFARLAAGASPTAVLSHYFPGTRLSLLARP